MDNAMLKFLYSNFHGRIGRKTFWLYYILPQWICITILGATATTYADGSIDISQTTAFLLFIIRIIVIMGFFKRLHDRGKSGWWFLLCLIPVIGDIYWFIDLGILPGKDKENKYGAPAPKQLEAVKNAKT